jgi:PhnB protein
LDTNDVDAAFKKAVEAGAKVSEEVADQPWGQRYGKIIDPFGFVWSLATSLHGHSHAVKVRSTVL